jgi:hypothetical protein
MDIRMVAVSAVVVTISLAGCGPVMCAWEGDKAVEITAVRRVGSQLNLRFDLVDRSCGGDGDREERNSTVSLDGYTPLDGDLIAQATENWEGESCQLRLGVPAEFSEGVWLLRSEAVVSAERAAVHIPVLTVQAREADIPIAQIFVMDGTGEVRRCHSRSPEHCQEQSPACVGECIAYDEAAVAECACVEPGPACDLKAASAAMETASEAYEEACAFGR